ncbi:hypothetical protein [Stutzerimonas nitrititolerans]|uniref:hypothetical protein n=1 Tax=Stutzerimonas nitrititolerans TaxID=2482751 RepID=UPI0028A92CDF|nr:hypothetical protein [Stutzerimonas nitrititolerans]
MSAIKKSIDDAGGVIAVSTACEVSPRAVYKWIAAESLPRTEYTGETCHAKRIAELAAANGKAFDPEWLLLNAVPRKSAA